MPGERVHVELGFFDDSGRAIIGARATPYEADGTTPLAGMKSAATGGSNITSVSTGVTGKAEFWITGLPRRYKVVWDDNSLTARVAGHVNPLAAFSVTRGPHDMVPPPLEAAQLDENQTWTGAQNFTGGLTVDGEELATDAALSAVSDAVTAEVTRATDREDEIDAALAQEVSDRDDADDARITTALRFAQLDRQGVNALGVTNGRVRKAFELADEVDVDWSTLIPYVNANATVSGNRLRATAVTSPSGVKIPFPLTASEDCAFSVIIEIGAANADGGVNKATMVGFYQADSASSIVASSTDAFTAGILSGSGSAFTIGRKAFSGAQTTLGDTDLVTGELIRVTGVTDSESVSLQVLRLSTGDAFQFRQARAANYDTAHGGVGGVLLYNDSTVHKIYPLSIIKLPTRPRTGTLAGVDVATYGRWGYYTAPSFDANERWWVNMPANSDPRTPTPLVLWLHNSSGSATNPWTDSRIKPFAKALVAAGYIVASANALDSAWGNDNSRMYYRKLYEYVRSRHAISSVVLVGPSMGGGQVALNILPRAEIPNIVAWLGIAPVTNLDELYANATYTSAIDTAFGISGDYQTKTEGYRPEDRDGWEFRGVAAMVVASPDDATCSLSNAQALIAKMAPYAPEATLITSTGPHMDAQQFTDAITYGIPFLQTYAPTPTGTYGAGAATSTGPSGDVTALWLPLLATDYVATPDNAAYTPTTSLDVRATIAPDDWTTVSRQTIVAHYATDSNQRSWDFAINFTDGKLCFRASADGTTTGNSFAVATAAIPGIADGQPCQVRAVWTPSSVSFYYRFSTAALTVDTGWTQIGTAVTSGVPATVFNPTCELRVGALASTTTQEPFGGKIRDALVKVDGAIVASPRFDAPVAPRYRDSAGRTWTFNGSAYCWAAA